MKRLLAWLFLALALPASLPTAAQDYPARPVHVVVPYSPGTGADGATGNGGPQHLAMELLKLETGIDVVHVPYKGAAGALADVVGGHVQAMISATQTAHPHVQPGKLRAIGLMSAERSPPIPTAVIQKVNTDINAVLKEPAIREAFGKQGMTPVGGPGAAGYRGEGRARALAASRQRRRNKG